MQPDARAVSTGSAQLFLDDDLVAAAQNVTRTWHPLEKSGASPVLTPVEPERVILLYGTVLREPDRDHEYRMWYFVHNNGGEVWLAHAESDDGVEWSRPALNQSDIAPNALAVPEQWRLIGLAGIVRDPNDVPEDERYKLMASVAHAESKEKRYLLAASPDGIVWHEVGTFIPDDPAYPDTCCFTIEPGTGRYLLYTRMKYAPPEVLAQDAPNFFGRAVALCTSDDFRTWSPHRRVMNVTTDDPLGTEIYSVMPYPAGDQWIGLHQIHQSMPTVGLVDIGVSHSRDGVRWQRERETVLPNGGPGEWDRYNQSVATQLVRVDDECRVYYSGRLYRHGEYRRAELPDTGPTAASIGFATIGVDRWCSMSASFDGGGSLTTQPVSLPSDALSINAASRFGEVVVEALDPNGGDVLATSNPVRGDGIALPVVWETGDLPSGRSVALRFRLTNARLYAWTSGAPA